MALTDLEERRLLALIEGRVPPINGMEIHFLKVLGNRASPHSPKEREWFEYFLDRHFRNYPQGTWYKKERVKRKEAVVNEIARLHKLEYENSISESFNEYLAKELSSRLAYLEDSIEENLEDYPSWRDGPA